MVENKRVENKREDIETITEDELKFLIMTNKDIENIENAFDTLIKEGMLGYEIDDIGNSKLVLTEAGIGFVRKMYGTL